MRTECNKNIGPSSGSGEAPAEQGVDYSGTNVQEEGVDEPDIVKTDGNTLFAVANGRLNAVDVSDPTPRLLDTLALNPAMGHELLLHGDRLLVLSRGRVEHHQRQAATEFRNSALLVDRRDFRQHARPDRLVVELHLAAEHHGRGCLANHFDFGCRRLDFMPERFRLVGRLILERRYGRFAHVERRDCRRGNARRNFRLGHAGRRRRRRLRFHLGWLIVRPFVAELPRH